MTLPPPTVLRRIRKLHALLGSSNEAEAAAAKKKLAALLAEYSCSWNDVPVLLAAGDVSSPQQATSAPPSADDGPAVNVFDLVAFLIKKHVAITPDECMAVGLWILHTWVFDRFTVTPRLALVSPVRGCGKTTLLCLAEYLTARPLRTDDITAAGVYHHLERSSRTCLLIDEADNADLLRNRTLRAVFNSGHRAGGSVTRFVGGWSKRFPTFAPLAVAAIGVLPLPLLHRSMLIRMQRRSPDTATEFLAGDNNEFSASRDQIRRWAATCRLDPNPEMPRALFNRAADNWRVLLSIADNLGHGEEARSVAVALTSDRPDEDPGVILLADIRSIFDRLGVDRIASADLVNELLAVNDYWADWHDARPGRKLAQTDLGRLLRPFHIRTKSIWPLQRTPSSRSRKGFSRDQFESAWRSYCPKDGTTAQRSKIIQLARR